MPSTPRFLLPALLCLAVAAVRALAGIRLKVNAEKTHILSPSDPLEWLGETIR